MKSAIQAKTWIADFSSLYLLFPEKFMKLPFRKLIVGFRNNLYLCKVQNDMADLTLHSNTESFIGDIKRLVEQGRNAAYGAMPSALM